MIRALEEWAGGPWEWLLLQRDSRLFFKSSSENSSLGSLAFLHVWWVEAQAAFILDSLSQDVCRNRSLAGKRCMEPGWGRLGFPHKRLRFPMLRLALLWLTPVLCGYHLAHFMSLVRTHALEIAQKRILCLLCWSLFFSSSIHATVAAQLLAFSLQVR